MADDKYKDPFLAISTVVIVLAAFGVTFFAKSPLKVLRPVTAVREPAEQVRARLWQDPFSAVVESQPNDIIEQKVDFFTIDSMDYPRKMVETGPLLTNITNMIKSGNKFVVLGIIVDGGPYDNDTESRIRYRVAVLTALKILDYVPEDAEHINFIRIQQKIEPKILKDRNKRNGRINSQPETTSNSSTGPALLSNIIPYEWLLNSIDPNKKILLLWLNDNSFDLQPLAKLNNLRKFLESPQQKLSLPYIIIGPPNSNKLFTMVEEISGFTIRRETWFADGVSMYSPMATLPNYLFYNSGKKENLNNLEAQYANRVRDRFRNKANINFQRTIFTDLKLLQGLIEELNNRQIDGPKNHIVLISEWDTKYGSSLPKIFLDIIKERTNTQDIHWVHVLSYMRGLDGIIPGLKDTSEQHQSLKDSNQDHSENNNKKSEKDMAEKLMKEEPIGRSQLDYLRRLADSLYQKDEQWQREGKGRIRAVGVLGTDFYDKYLIYQAFKQRFPAAIFFTTDMDARLLHEAYNDSTKNLIVASGFDLELPEGIKLALMTNNIELAPFRSSYQTAMFYAVLKAFKCAEKTPAELCPKILENLQLGDLDKAYLFEIGRQHAVNLNASKTLLLPSKEQTAWILFFIFVATFFTWIISLQFRKWLKNHLFFFLFLLMILAFAYYSFQNSVLHNSKEEPLSFFEGISIWPTEIIRLMACIFSWIFLMTAREKLQQNDTKLKDEFYLKPPLPQPWHIYIIKREWFYPPSIQTSNNEILINPLWKSYQQYNSGIFQILRVLSLTSLYMTLPVMLLIIFNFPDVPGRGSYSFHSDHVILFATIFSFLFLTFFVFDNSRLLRWFINEALGKQPKWNPESREKFVDKNTFSGEEIDFWMLISLVAQRTEVINQLIFYPFIIWLMLFISRWPYFDNWTTSPALLIIIAMSAVITWSCAIFLNRTAEKLRTEIMARLSMDLVHLESDSSSNSARQSLVKSIIEEVKNIKQGAFTPFFQNPVVQALFVPFGGIGGLTILEFLNKLS